MSKSKIIITSGIVCSLLFAGCRSFATSTGVINTDTVKMRAEASTDSKIVMLVSINDKVEILEESGDWYKVKFDGNTGYIYAQYVDNKDKKEEVSTKNNTVANNTITNTATNSTANTIVNNTANENIVSESTNTINENTQVSDKIEISSTITLNSDVEIRLVPLINSTVVNKIVANTKVTVKDYINGWYCISSTDIEGWVREEKITNKNALESNEENKEIDTAEKKENEVETNLTKYVNTEKVNVRKDASTNSDIVKSVSKNTKINVIAIKGDWSKVKIGEDIGYISSSYLSDKKVEDNTSSTNNSTNTTSSNTSKYTNTTKNTVTNRGLDVSRTEETETKSKTGSDIVSYAKKFLGTKYVWGGATPKGFDCSGFTAYVYKNYGIDLAHSARAQAVVGSKVEKSNLQLGDLVIFNGESNTSIGHVGIYVGGNQFIHASNPSDGVKITSLSTQYYLQRYVTARRVL